MAFNSLLTKGKSFTALKNAVQIQQSANGHSVAAAMAGMTKEKIGSREIVGFGLNGQPNYFDKLDIPMPAIRFKEITPDIQVLREKEKSDWKKLSLEEKKALYRYSFCQTLSEIKAPTGDWKGVVGVSFFGMSIALWLFILLKLYVYPPLPVTFEPERQKAQLQRMIDLRMNPIDGLASKWDYEKGKWKE
ncbi:cytochrome c oxidase subunit 4 isoform 2, mitochondrial [Armadillidium vulgare]|nr:cytochrome c oxidase subunit 4 isoform 2, mitochondrial [Armadillidium vulgare]